MFSFVVRRSLGAVATFVMATVVIFVVTFVLPGDPARVIAGRRQVPESTLTAIRERYGLDRPLPARYLDWVGGVIRGDLGESYASRRPVTAMLTDAMPITVRLLLITIVIESALAASIGAWSGARRGGAVDQAATAGSTMAIAVPLLVLASVTQYIVGVRWHLLPTSGTTWAGLVLPALVLALPGAALGTRIFRAEILERRHDHHVVVAMGKGLGEWTVVRRHVLRNSLIPLLTFLALDAAALVGGAIVVERVFNLPGVGGLTARAISQRDTPLIVGVTLVSVAVFLVVDLLIDVMIVFLDPRIRSQS